VRVIVIRAEGRGFCAGVDIKELAADGNLIVAVNKGNGCLPVLRKCRHRRLSE
jgi:enoyl-CoA hydratase/carnithine racemase